MRGIWIRAAGGILDVCLRRAEATREGAARGAAIPLAVLLAALAAAPAAANHKGSHVRKLHGGKVLLIGDSHTWLGHHVVGYGGWDYDATTGRRASGAYARLARTLRPRHRKVIFDIATNDAQTPPSSVRRTLRLVRTRLNRRGLGLVTCHRIDHDNDCTRINRVLRSFARNDARVRLTDWGRIAKARPGFFGPDGVHFTTAGYTKRVAYVKERAARVPGR